MKKLDNYVIESDNELITLFLQDVELRELEDYEVIYKILHSFKINMIFDDGNYQTSKTAKEFKNYVLNNIDGIIKFNLDLKKDILC